jgi:hypothetical protein
MNIYMRDQRECCNKKKQKGVLNSSTVVVDCNA